MDKTIYTMHNGKMTLVNDPQLPQNANFVIVCTYGDWSGFRTLQECQNQFPELEKMETHRPGRGFAVVER